MAPGPADRKPRLVFRHKLPDHIPLGVHYDTPVGCSKDHRDGAWPRRFTIEPGLQRAGPAAGRGEAGVNQVDFYVVPGAHLSQERADLGGYRMDQATSDKSE